MTYCSIVFTCILKYDVVTCRCRYKIAQAISLGHDYGWPRVMSSYDFGDDTDTGPPHDGNYKSVSRFA